jgi:hypothetical protein
MEIVPRIYYPLVALQHRNPSEHTREKGAASVFTVTAAGKVRGIKG